MAFDRSTWTLLEAKDLSKSLTAIEPDDKAKTTGGRFIRIRFRLGR